jgi:hypothetical protein
VEIFRKRVHAVQEKNSNEISEFHRRRVFGWTLVVALKGIDELEVLGPASRHACLAILGGSAALPAF